MGSYIHIALSSATKRKRCAERTKEKKEKTGERMTDIPSCLKREYVVAVVLAVAMMVMVATGAKAV